MKNCGSIVVATPYRENAVSAIARAAASNGVLNRFFTTLYLGGVQGKSQKIPLIGTRVSRELSRRAFSGIPSERVSSAALLAEIEQIVVRRVLGRRLPALATNLMYRVKEKFDVDVASRMPRENPDVFVGMYGASARSFEKVHESGGAAVLNFVNSHPAEHNRFLRELGGLSKDHHEMIPDWIASRVEYELSIADLVLAPSRFVAEQLVQHGVSPTKTAMIPYGVDLRAFSPGDRWARSKAATLECLYVGQMSHRKGVPILIEAARRLLGSPVRFLLIGPIVSGEVLERLPESVRYLGPMPPVGIAEAMNRADVMILPTLEDACALVVLEAMASGLPVITTHNNGSGEFILNGQNGLLVRAGDVVAVCEAVMQCIDDRSQLELIGARARESVQAAHSWDHYGQRVMSAIDAIAMRR